MTRESGLEKMGGGVAELSETAERRHTAPVRSGLLWILICAVVVIVAHAVLRPYTTAMNPYISGIAAAAAFVLAALYSLRKRSIFFALRGLRAATRPLPRRLRQRIILFDRMETWRFLHLTVGMLMLLPLWWHLDNGLPASTLELALAACIGMLLLSGFVGVTIQDLLPGAMNLRPEYETRPQDIEQRFNELYVQAEELILGHSEKLNQTYVNEIRPLLRNSRPLYQMLWATLSGWDPAPYACRFARARIGELGEEKELYQSLVGVAERKVRLENNLFNLHLDTGWLTVHISLFTLTACLLVLHVLGALYFRGL